MSRHVLAMSICAVLGSLTIAVVAGLSRLLNLHDWLFTSWWGGYSCAFGALAIGNFVLGPFSYRVVELLEHVETPPE